VPFLLACTVVVLALAACNGGGEEEGGGVTTPGAGTDTPGSPTAAPSGGTVEISLWHSEQASNLDSLQRLARRFNDSQSEVKVKLQGSSDENMAKVLASLQGGDLPTIAYLDEVLVRGLEETVVNDKDPIEALNDAAEEANKVIEDYNRRIQ